MDKELYIWDGKANPKRRLALEVECSYCGKVFLKAKRFVKNENYCCKEHSNLSRMKREYVKCDYCGKRKLIKASRLKKSKTGHFFCDRKCQSLAQMHENTPTYNCYVTKNGKSTYRPRAFREYPHKCAECGYDKVLEILEVHHIDGDRNNNTLENLIILCPNHHRMLSLGLALLNENRRIVLIQ